MNYENTKKEIFTKNLLVKKIQKESISHKIIPHMEEEYLFLFCKNEKKRHALAEISFEKDFRYTGLGIRIPKNKKKEEDFWEKKLISGEIASEKMKYRELIEELQYPYSRIVLWGTGMWGDRFLSLFQYYHIPVLGFCDKNPER